MVLDENIPALFEELLAPVGGHQPTTLTTTTTTLTTTTTEPASLKRRKEEDDRVVRKRARERRRRAEVGEKFNELVKVLGEAEAASGVQFSPDQEDDGTESRVVILERAIAFVKSVPAVAEGLSLKADERTVAGSLLGFQRQPTKSFVDRECQTDGLECLVVAKTILTPRAVESLCAQIPTENTTTTLLSVGPNVDEADAAISHFLNSPLNGRPDDDRRFSSEEPRFDTDGAKSYFALEA